MNPTPASQPDTWAVRSDPTRAEPTTVGAAVEASGAGDTVATRAGVVKAALLLSLTFSFGASTRNCVDSASRVLSANTPAPDDRPVDTTVQPPGPASCSRTVRASGVGRWPVRVTVWLVTGALGDIAGTTISFTALDVVLAVFFVLGSDKRTRFCPTTG